MSDAKPRPRGGAANGDEERAAGPGRGAAQIDLSAARPLPPPAWLEERARALGVEFEGDDVERIGLYLGLLLEANKSFNLTAIDDPEKAWERHALDSLTLLSLIAEAGAGARVADIGAGGGAPSLPLAIALPQAQFTLIEATRKKAEFLERAIEALRLTNAVVVCERAETVGQDHRRYREQFDVATARAVGKIAVVAELAAPLLRIGGRALLIKGAQAEQELKDAEKALRALRLSCDGIAETPTGKIVVLRKDAATPRQYPRRPGEPGRAPLG